jgi:hypothetical protein
MPDARKGAQFDLKKAVDDERGTVSLRTSHAGVAQLVEHHLAKVDVESSSLFARSIFQKTPAPERLPGFLFAENRGSDLQEQPFL